MQCTGFSRDTNQTENRTLFIQKEICLIIGSINEIVWYLSKCLTVEVLTNTQSTFWPKNKKKYNPCKPHLSLCETCFSVMSTSGVCKWTWFDGSRILTKSGRAPPQPVTLTFNVMTPKTIGVLLWYIQSLKVLGRKVFELSQHKESMDGRTDKQTDRQTHERTDDVITIGHPHLSMRGP